MIELQTGLPGNGKTLYTLDRIEALRKRTGRPVFYSGIPIHRDKLPDWHQLDDPARWFDCPPESIVVIDEAQRLFRPRASGSAVPEYESRLETHRHGGIDLVLLTQQPRLIALNVRELCGRHLHIVRSFGMSRATVHEWPECHMNTQTRKDSIKHIYSYNKAVYTWYKSSEAHTYKASIPAKLWLLGGIVVGLPILGYVAFAQMSGKADAPSSAPSVSRALSPSVAASGPKQQSTAEWLAKHQPRVNGLAYTAPAYDEVTKPTRAPYPAACVQSRTRCQCYTQQGTRLDVPKDLCVSISEGGFFMAWDERSQSMQPVATPRPEVKLDGGNPEAIGINVGYQPQRVPFSQSQSPQVDQAPTTPRANRQRATP
ncbi:MAG: zonular occludens toxin domain-containing protein [Pseudomonadota bacterium]